MCISKIQKLCAKSKLKLVEDAYCDITEWEAAPSDKKLIEEIEWKLECAIGNYEEGSDDSYTKRDFTYTKKFIAKLKGLL